MTLEQKRLIAERLHRLLVEGDGRLELDRVIADARDPTSPTHTEFTWDDTLAAQERRYEQARQLIRSVRVVEVVDRRAISVVCYVHDPSDQRRSGYVETVSLIDDRERGIETLTREFTRIEGLVKRSRDIATVLGLENEFEAMLANVIATMNDLRRAA